MDAAGAERAVVFGISEGGPMSIAFAVAHPERTLGLVLHGTRARFAPDADDEVAEVWHQPIPEPGPIGGGVHGPDDAV